MQQVLQNMPKGKLIIWFFLAALLAMATYSLYVAGYITLGKGNYITVTGTSNSVERNQVATFTATVMSTNAEKSKAVAQMNTRAKTITDSIKNFGIDVKDIKTTNLNVYQQQNWDQTTQKYSYGDWSASVSIELKLHDVSKASEISALLASLETSSLYGPNFTVDDDKVDEAALLEKALSDAKTKASAIAKASGRKLGEMTMFVEGVDYNNPPYMYDKMGMGGGGGELPIEPGSSTVSKTVTVTYRLN